MTIRKMTAYSCSESNPLQSDFSQSPVNITGKYSVILYLKKYSDFYVDDGLLEHIFGRIRTSVGVRPIRYLRFFSNITGWIILLVDYQQRVFLHMYALSDIFIIEIYSGGLALQRFSPEGWLYSNFSEQWGNGSGKNDTRPTV